ncbi:MAG TPA: sulfurtransferase [Chitinophagaceae bacterium]
MTPIIKPHELVALRTSPDLLLIDARTGPGAKEAYHSSHLDGALYIDLEEELSKKGPSPAVGGRHPLPPVEQFAALLGTLGVQPTSHVVVYDDKAGANPAARLWWMLRALGHETVQVLDGGMEGALAAGYPANAETVTPTPVAPYPAKSWGLPMAGVEEVERAAADKNLMVIDVRDAVRYRGEKEPIDKIAGHIPGAVNLPFSNNLNAQGRFRDPQELRQFYSDALGDKRPDNIIVHCGSGVTACHTLLAMDYAGLSIPKLYVGSWSEWSNSGRPVATGVEA